MLKLHQYKINPEFCKSRPHAIFLQDHDKNRLAFVFNFSYNKGIEEAKETIDIISSCSSHWMVEQRAEEES